MLLDNLIRDRIRLTRLGKDGVLRRTLLSDVVVEVEAAFILVVVVVVRVVVGLVVFVL